MFNGRSALTLDIKNRMSIPAKYRDALIDPDSGRPQVAITQHPDGCLLLYPLSVWAVKREQIAKFPESKRWLRRLLLGSAVDVELDGNGRVLLSPELRELAGIGNNKEVMLVGMGEGFEIWDVAALVRKEAEDKAKMRADEEDISL